MAYLQRVTKFRLHVDVSDKQLPPCVVRVVYNNTESQ